MKKEFVGLPIRQQPPTRPGQTGRAVTTGGIPLPVEVAHSISLRAAQYVRQAAPVGRTRSRNFIRATWRKGEVGVHIPARARHLLYLDRGIRPFVMWTLAGKTIPIRGPNGAIMFRRAGAPGSPTAPGTRRVDARDERGRIVRSSIRWRHPGVEPMNFIEPNIMRAISEWGNTQKAEDIIRMFRGIPEVGRFFQQMRRTR